MTPQVDAAMTAGAGPRSLAPAEAEGRSLDLIPTNGTSMTFRGMPVGGLVMKWLGGDHASWAKAEGLLVAAREGQGATVAQLLTSTQHSTSEESSTALSLWVDVCDRWGNNGLILSSVRGHEGVVACLLAHGADPNLRNAMGASPLFYAATRGHHGVVTLLLRYGARLGPVLRVGAGWGGGCWHPLVGAAANGHARVIHTLLHLQQDTDTEEDGLCTAWEVALWAACARGQPSSLPPLLFHSFTPSPPLPPTNALTSTKGKGRAHRNITEALALASEAALQASNPQCSQLLQWLEVCMGLVYGLAKLRAIADCQHRNIADRQPTPHTALSRRIVSSTPLPSLTFPQEIEGARGAKRGRGGHSLAQGVLEEVVTGLAPDAFVLLSQLLIGHTH